jgi:hypothetical protein
VETPAATTSSVDNGLCLYRIQVKCTEAIRAAALLRFYPHRKARKMRLEPYREAWHLLQGEKTGQTGKIELQASADESIYPDPSDAHVGDGRIRPSRERSERAHNGPCGDGRPRPSGGPASSGRSRCKLTHHPHPPPPTPPPPGPSRP